MDWDFCFLRCFRAGFIVASLVFLPLLQLDLQSDGVVVGEFEASVLRGNGFDIHVGGDDKAVNLVHHVHAWCAAQLLPDIPLDIPFPGNLSGE